MGKTSSAVKNKYNAKTYKRYQLFLRLDEDAEYIDFIEKAKEDGITLREIILNGIDATREQLVFVTDGE